MSNFIDKIKHKMVEKHINEKQLSDMIGCSETLLSVWLEEIEEMPVMVADDISKVLDINKKEKTITSRYNKLSDANKKKVLEYIEFLQYKEKKLKLSNETDFQ